MDNFAETCQVLLQRSCSWEMGMVRSKGPCTGMQMLHVGDSLGSSQCCLWCGSSLEALGVRLVQILTVRTVGSLLHEAGTGQVLPCKWGFTAAREPLTQPRGSPRDTKGPRGAPHCSLPLSTVRTGSPQGKPCSRSSSFEWERQMVPVGAGGKRCVFCWPLCY